MTFESLATRCPQCDLKWDSQDWRYKMKRKWKIMDIMGDQTPSCSPNILKQDLRTPKNIIEHPPDQPGVRPSHCQSFTLCWLCRKITLSLARHLNTQSHRGPIWWQVVRQLMLSVYWMALIHSTYHLCCFIDLSWHIMVYHWWVVNDFDGCQRISYDLISYRCWFGWLLNLSPLGARNVI